LSVFLFLIFGKMEAGFLFSVGGTSEHRGFPLFDRKRASLPPFFLEDPEESGWGFFGVNAANFFLFFFPSVREFLLFDGGAEGRFPVCRAVPPLPLPARRGRSSSFCFDAGRRKPRSFFFSALGK